MLLFAKKPVTLLHIFFNYRLAQTTLAKVQRQGSKSIESGDVSHKR